MTASRRDPPTGDPAHSDGWLLVRGARRLRRDFEEAWATQPDADARRWWIGLALLLGSAAGLAYALPQLMRAAEGYAWLDWEARVVDSAEDWPISFGTALILDALASPLFLIPLVLVGAVVAVRRKRPVAALVILAAYFAVSLPVMFGWMIWPRPRPEAILAGAASPGFSAFPSGHVTQATAVYGTLTAIWVLATKRRAERLLAVVLLLLILTAVGVARLRLGVHWPTDVAAGLIIGSMWTFGSGWLLRASSAEQITRRRH